MARMGRRPFLKHGFMGLAAMDVTSTVPPDVASDSVRQSFDSTGPWLRSCPIHELWDRAYPCRMLFALLRSVGYNRYAFAEIQGSCEPIRLTHNYRKLWKYKVAA